jgi:glyoxylase-like metal-dependent hydrolase (beta-lactamase superfamily II)
MQVQVFSGGPFFENCYVLYSDRGGEGVVVDPGTDFTKIKSFVGGRKLRIHSVLLTHGHVDHVLCVNEVHGLTGARVLLHPADRKLYDNAVAMAAFFGIPNLQPQRPPDGDLLGGARIPIGDEALEVIHTPGHSPGSLCFQLPGHFVVTGDTLFYDGIGRTDLPGGSNAQIQDSLKHRLLCLPRDLVVYPGHGPQSTIGYEHDNNAFIEW